MPREDFSQPSFPAIHRSIDHLPATRRKLGMKKTVRKASRRDASVAAGCGVFSASRPLTTIEGSAAPSGVVAAAKEPIA